jgi:hypothetical protein
MRYGLDFVDLENPKVRPPTVRLEDLGANIHTRNLTYGR